MTVLKVKANEWEAQARNVKSNVEEMAKERDNLDFGYPSVQVGDLKVLSNNDTNFDHLRLAVGVLGSGPEHKENNRARYLGRMEMLRAEIFIGRDALIKLCGK